MSTRLSRLQTKSLVLVFAAITALGCAGGSASALAQDATAKSTPAPGASALKWMKWDHVAIRVPNFAETVKWYGDKLGFKVVKQWKGPPFLHGGLDFAYLENNGVMLEIIGGAAPVRAGPQPASLQELLVPLGWNHLCLRVENMEATLVELKRLGVEPYASIHNPVLNRLIVQIVDNNGIPIEIVQYLDK